MKNIIQWLFFPNWVVIESARGKWNIHEEFFNIDYTKFCSYTIYYSRIRCKFKLKMRGHSPYNHPLFPVIMGLMGQYQRGELTIKIN